MNLATAPASVRSCTADSNTANVIAVRNPVGLIGHVSSGGNETQVQESLQMA